MEENNQTEPVIETIFKPEEKKETRGRKKLEEKMGFIDIDGYIKENEVNENTIPPEAQQNVIDNENINVNEKDKDLVTIEINAKNLMLAEAFIDGIVQKILNLIGFKMELNPMSENDLEIWAKLCPPIELKRSWENFIKFYLIAKAKN